MLSISNGYAISHSNVKFGKLNPYSAESKLVLGLPSEATPAQVKAALDLPETAKKPEVIAALTDRIIATARLFPRLVAKFPELFALAT
jgi:hypothetical protein